MNIALLGDLALCGIINSSAYSNPQRFAYASAVLQKHDLVFANLEVPLRGDTPNENKSRLYWSEKIPTGDVLKMLNIGCVSLANNHIYDFKMGGLKATIGMLDELGISHTGAGWLREHTEPVFIDIGGMRIAFLAFVDECTNPKTESYPELFINRFDPKTAALDIAGLRNGVDLIICSIHWGTDYSHFPERWQVKAAHAITDAGADIVLGHHPHTLQPYEKYNNGTIFYSLGGLTFGDIERNGKTVALYRKTKKSVIVQYNITEKKFSFTGVKELRENFLKPCKINFSRWSDRYRLLNRIRESSSITRWLFDFHEKTTFRIFDYFFGYYHNPLKRLFQFSNVYKLKKLLFGKNS